VLRVTGRQSLSLRSPVVTLGTFDGVHIGHQKVLSDLVAWARTARRDSVVLTFDQPPRVVVSGQAVPIITPVEKKLSLLEASGVDAAVVLHFDQELAQMGAEEFVRSYVVDWLRASGVIVGYYCQFGRGRSGDVRLLASIAKEYGFEFRTSEPVKVGGYPVSSTTVRGAVLAGDLKLARKLLGRHYSLIGTVIHGDGRGHALGFPTANLQPLHTLRPPAGVYAGRAAVRGRCYPALVSIGIRPTFHPSASEAVTEVYLEGFHDLIYGELLEAEFFRLIRKQRTFSSRDALVRQMERDREELLRELEPGVEQ